MTGKAKYLFLFFFLFPAVLQAQNNTIIPVQSWEYEYIKQLQFRGHLLELNPFSLPYTTVELRKAVEDINVSGLNKLEQSWYEELKKSLLPRPKNVGDFRVGGNITTGGRRSSSGRLNVINPAGKAKPILPRTELKAYMEWDNFIGQAGTTFDWFYDVDPVGLDLANRLYIRSEDTYFGYNSEYFDAYVGRYSNHWSIFDQQGAFLTDNSRSFDHLNLRFGNSTISFSSILGELDNLDSDGNFSGRGFGPGSIRRYIFLHRVDWSIAPNLRLSFMEGELYFSETAGIQFRNLLPLHFLFFESHNVPRNVDSNLFLGGSLYYQFSDITFFTQLMLDDVHVSNNEEPITFTANNSITFAPSGKRFALGTELDIVSAFSYRPFLNRRADQWTYGQRGLATNFSDYIQTRAYLTLYPKVIEGMKLEPYVSLYFKGEGDFRKLRSVTNPPGTPESTILTGTVEQTIRPALKIRYQGSQMKVFGAENDIRFNWWFEADAGINFIKNQDNTVGLSDRKFIGLFEFFGKISF